jgi:hypothetical protein
MPRSIGMETQRFQQTYFFCLIGSVEDCVGGRCYGLVKAFEDHCEFFGDCFFGLEEGFFLRVIVEAGCEVAVVHPSKVNEMEMEKNR